MNPVRFFHFLPLAFGLLIFACGVGFGLAWPGGDGLAPVLTTEQQIGREYGDQLLASVSSAVLEAGAQPNDPASEARLGKGLATAFADWTEVLLKQLQRRSEERIAAEHPEELPTSQELLTQWAKGMTCRGK